MQKGIVGNTMPIFVVRQNTEMAKIAGLKVAKKPFEAVSNIAPYIETG